MKTKATSGFGVEQTGEKIPIQRQKCAAVTTDVFK